MINKPDTIPHTTKKEPPMRYCFNCGKEIGRSFDHDQFETCGDNECDTQERLARAEARRWKETYYDGY